jgi:predicted NUDIX family NTP pyrophosphohydrolase
MWENGSMPKLSAGLIPYRIRDGVLEVFVVHPGGPFWAKKDDGAWSITKGEYEEGEEPQAVALREFEEETGVVAPPGPLIELGEIKQPSGKKITAWAVRADDFTVSEIKSNTFDMEWPKGSGRIQSFVEVDRADWFALAACRRKLLKGQVEFLDHLIEKVTTPEQPLSEGEPTDSTNGQASLF